MAVNEMTEDQAVNLMRNALLVAGHEMGSAGDHWPVINATVFQIMRDLEQLKIERNVDAELKIHLYAQLAQIEREVANCPDALKPDALLKIKELREIYDAYFSEFNEKAAPIQEEEIPVHIKRAKAIIASLEDEDG